jgi:hypothetical protein
MDPTTGRPRKTQCRGKSPITPEQDEDNRKQVKILASAGCTLEETAAVLHICEVWRSRGRTFDAC